MGNGERGASHHVAAGTVAPAYDMAQCIELGVMFYDSSYPFVGWMGDDGRNGGAWHHVQVQFPRVLLPQPDLVNRLIGKRLSNQNGCADAAVRIPA